MAANLLDAGYELIVWNRTASKTATLRERGVTAADSPADVVRHGAEVICINVTDTPDVEAVLFGKAGVMTANPLPEGLIVIDHSTISPVATRDFADRLAREGVTLLDAPVSGGDSGAKAGTLSIMVGGDDGAFDRCRPLLDVVGSSVVRVGDSGAGQACKACNQVAVSLNLLGTVEAIALARQFGLDPGKMIEVVSQGAGGSWQLANLGPKILAGDYKPGFTIDYLLKDLGIVAETAETLDLPLPGVTVARSRFRTASDAGHGHAATQALARLDESTR